MLGTGPEAELCPFDAETWAIAKILMTTKPQWRIDRLFSLDDPNDMLSIRVENSMDEFMGVLTGFDEQSQKYVASMRRRAEIFSGKVETKQDEEKFIDTIHTASSETEAMHNSLMGLTKIREGIQYQNKFTGEDFKKKINARRVPFVTQKRYPDIPLSVPFPLKEVVAKYGTPYFTNTICYMIAMALLEGVTHLQLWGIVQGGYSEYLRERKGVEYWLGHAAGQGVNVEVRGVTSLFENDNNGKLYGYKKTWGELTQ